MIDSNWFEQVICISGAKVPSDMIEHLCRELGDETELLPYIILNSEAFSEWSETSDALRYAVHGVIRPRTLPHREGHCVTAAERDQLRKAMFGIIEVPRNNNMQDTENDDMQELSNLSVECIIGKFRSYQSKEKEDPRWFIY